MHDIAILETEVHCRVEYFSNCHF